MNHLLTFLAITINADDAGIPRVNANQNTVDGLINGVFFVAAAIATLFIVINALRYVISQGDAGRISQAKDGILYSLAGLVIISVSFAIVQLVINVIRG